MWAAAIALSHGCGFDSSGLGGATHGVEDTTTGAAGDSSGTISTESTSTDAASAGDGSGSVSSASESTMTGADSTTTGSDSGASTTASDPCQPAPFFKVSVVADNATLQNMDLDQLPQPVGPYAYSEVAGEGQATFEFDVDCPGTYSIHGLVYDADQLTLANADSFEVSVDQGDWHVWPYGCQIGLSPWRYRRVRTDAVEDLQCLISQELTFSLQAGTHTVTLRNLESGSHGGTWPGSVAAVARILVTNDPGYSPDVTMD